MFPQAPHRHRRAARRGQVHARDLLSLGRISASATSSPACPGGRAASRLTVQAEAGAYSLPATRWCWPRHSARTPFKCNESGLPWSARASPSACALSTQAAVSRRPIRHLLDSSPPPTISWPATCPRPFGLHLRVCPGGQVVAAASGAGQVVTNACPPGAVRGPASTADFSLGETADFGGDRSPAGVRFQEQWERAAFGGGRGRLPRPASWRGTFLAAAVPRGPPLNLAHLPPGVTWGPGRRPSRLCAGPHCGTPSPI